MYLKLSFFLVIFLQISPHDCEQPRGPGNSYHPENQRPTVAIALMIRNKAHTLPYFLGFLENLDYPKDRISLWIRTDHNEDNSTAMIREWVDQIRGVYHYIDFHADETHSKYSDASGPCHWSPSRFLYVMQLKQKALEAARLWWADYIFYIDVDVMLLNNQTLNSLMSQQKTIVAPMLNATTSEYYSNFWCGMDDNGYYKRTDDYYPILSRSRQGIFPVPMVHSTVLINLKLTESNHIKFYPAPRGYQGPFDDIIIFAFNCKNADIPMHILNNDYYGHMLVPMEPSHILQDEIDQFIFLKLEAMVEISDNRLLRSPYVSIPKNKLDKMNFGQVYMINLVRRPDRRERMLETLDELGIEAQIVDAVDGKQLNDTYLIERGIKMLPGFADPYHGRALTMGEIGCFMSHYNIWEDMMRNNYEEVIVFEDDVRFEPYFRQKLARVMQEASYYIPDWDLIYLGRKKLNHQDESYVKGSESLVYAEYSYWTLSYLLSKRGAKKLLDMKPLERMVPVDEYLPIMFDRHPEGDWKYAFEPRNLIGLSVEPLLVFPTHYTGEPNYISDTEDSNVIKKGTTSSAKEPSLAKINTIPTGTSNDVKEEL